MAEKKDKNRNRNLPCPECKQYKYSYREGVGPLGRGVWNCSNCHRQKTTYTGLPSLSDENQRQYHQALDAKARRKEQELLKEKAVEKEKIVEQALLHAPMEEDHYRWPYKE